MGCLGQRLTNTRGVESHSNSKVGGLSVTPGGVLRGLWIDVSNPQQVAAETEVPPRMFEIKQPSFLNR